MPIGLVHQDAQQGCGSIVGQGSTFHFTLPLIETEAETGAADAQRPATPSMVVSPRSILLVDDLSINLEIVGEMLRSAGHRVTFANSGPSAIAAYRARRHDLILMDVQMPDMDGLETTRRIRDLDGEAMHVPVIALTANVFSQQIESYRDAGMNDHLGKPFHRDRLLAMIERWTSPAEPDIAPGEAGVAIGPLDRTCQTELARLIGIEKTRELLLRFRDELPDRFRSAASPPPQGGRACDRLDRGPARLREALGRSRRARAGDRVGGGRLAAADRRACRPKGGAGPHHRNARGHGPGTLGQAEYHAGKSRLTPDPDEALRRSLATDSRQIISADLAEVAKRNAMRESAAKRVS